MEDPRCQSLRASRTIDLRARGPGHHGPHRGEVGVGVEASAEARQDRPRARPLWWPQGQQRSRRRRQATTTARLLLSRRLGGQVCLREPSTGGCSFLRCSSPGSRSCGQVDQVSSRHQEGWPRGPRVMLATILTVLMYVGNFDSPTSAGITGRSLPDYQGSPVASRRYSDLSLIHI